MQNIAPSCQNCEKRSVSIFCSLPKEACDLIDLHKVHNRYKKGQYIFYSGNTPTGLYCINKGSVRLEADSPIGNGHILRLVKAGGVLGYRSLFADESYSASAVAQDDCEICLISKQGLSELIQKFPEVAIRLLKQVSIELRQSEERFCSMTDKSASERVAESLVFLKDKFHEYNWTRKEIADWAGTTPETVIRTLSDFEKVGLIKQQGRKITILNKNALVEKANLND